MVDGVTFGTATVTLAFPVAAAPTFTPAAGTYSSAQSVTISSSTSGASIRYTTDGTTPSETAGTLYAGPFAIGTITTIKAIAYESGYTDSSVSSGTYNISIPQVSTPTFSPAAGTYASAQTVTISTSTSGASIRYTTDGSTPSETAGTLYSSPVTVSATETVKAIAYESGWSDSSVASASYTINSGGSNWYSSAWSYRKPITINATQVSGSSNLTNFPVLISLSSDSNLASSAQAGGNDILFTDSSGINKLPHEIESYNSSTGQLVAWVQVPTLSPTSNTVLYMYYGNSSVGSQQNPTAVWDSNYKSVYHLSQNPGGTAPQLTDSTGNANSLTVQTGTQGSQANASSVTGEIGNAVYFPTSNQYQGTYATSSANSGIGTTNGTAANRNDC